MGLKSRLFRTALQQFNTSHEKIFLRVLTTRLVRDNQTIALEDLAVKNMVKNRKLALSLSVISNPVALE